MNKSETHMAKTVPNH